MSTRIELFSTIPDCHVIVHQGGVYKQLPLARRGDELYAAVGSGFVDLRGRGSTTHPKMRWIGIDYSTAAVRIDMTGGQFGAPCIR